MEVLETKQLVRSVYMQRIERGEEAIIWHSLFGHPKIVSSDTLLLIDAFYDPRSPQSVSEEYEVAQDGMRIINDLRDGYFLVPDGFNERNYLATRQREWIDSVLSGNRVEYLELIVSEACNLRCKYCIHFSNLEQCGRLVSTPKIMSYKVAQRAVTEYLEILRGHGKKQAYINFGGGETLLAWHLVERMLNYCITCHGHEFSFRFSLNTNATLLTSKIAVVLKQFNVEVAVSLDGLQEANDLVRRTATGNGTFTDIVRGIDLLNQVGHPIDGVAVTVNTNNFPLIDEKLVDWAAARSMHELRIDIDVVGIVGIPVSEVAVKLIFLRNYAKKYGIEIIGFWSRPAENLNESTITTPVAFCGAVRGNSLCVSPSGDIYGCGYSAMKLGSIYGMESLFRCDSTYYALVSDRSTGGMTMCQGCAIEGQCGGGCHITQEFTCSSQTIKVWQMCELYRHMTRELLLDQLSDENIK